MKKGYVLLATAPLCLSLTSCKQIALTGETNFTAEQIQFVYEHKEGYESVLTLNENITEEAPYLSDIHVTKAGEDAVKFYFFETHDAAKAYGEKIQLGFIDWIKNIINGKGVEMTVTYNNITMQLKDYSILDELRKLSEEAEKLPDEIPENIPEEIPQVA